VRGRLFACTSGHQRLKSDQLLRLLRLSRLAGPTQKPAVPDPNRATGEIVWAPHMREQHPSPAQQPIPRAPEKARRILAKTDERMILLTTVATIVVVVGMVFGLVA
jgi:hypothetical protein